MFKNIPTFDWVLTIICLILIGLLVGIYITL